MNNYLNQTTVAVIIPTFKCAATIHRAISSIMKQTHPVDEIIIIDDYSSESAIIKSIADSFPRVKYICNDNRLGMAEARNIGLYSTKCEVVAFMDADDESHPQRIEMQLRYLTANSVVSCEVVRVIDKSKPAILYYTKARIKSNFSPYINALFNRITGAAMMSETALLRKVGGFDKDLPGLDDLDIYLRLLNLGYKVKKIMLPLYFYYDTAGSLSKDQLRIWNLYVKTINKFVISRFGNSSSWKAALFWFLVLFKESVRSILDNNKDLRKAVVSEVCRVSCLPALKGLLLLFFRVFNGSNK